MLDVSNLGPKRLVHNSIEPAGSLGLKLIITPYVFELNLKIDRNVMRYMERKHKMITHETISCTLDTKVSKRFMPSLKASSAEEY
jgi:hypothetical protein